MFILFIAFDEGERIVFPGDLKCPAVIDRGRCHMISGFGRHLGVAGCLPGWLAGCVAKMTSISCETFSAAGNW